MDNKTINLETIGEVKLFRSKKAKRINITIKPFEGIRVSVPGNTSFQKAEEFVMNKKIWIKKNIEKIRLIEKKHTVFDSTTNFETKYHKLELLPGVRDDIKLVVKDYKIKLYYPEKKPVKSNCIQMAIRKGIDRALRNEAKLYLPVRVKELSENHGFNHHKIFIKNNRSRWGSCSEKNNINLSIHLMRLPEHLIDYVILHELVHTVHKNHGKDFWQLLDTLTGNAKKMDKELKQYRIVIY